MKHGSKRLWVQGLLLEPTYGYGEVAPRKPSTREVWVEWIDAIAFWKESSRLLAAAHVSYHLATFALFLMFLVWFFSIYNILIALLASMAIGMVYNTVWYHRYCSHRAFKFRSIWIPRLFLWTNPVCFREESYVIPHRIHHSVSDQAGDPYGPHLGRVGSYLATESQQKINRDLSPRDYERLSRGLRHIGFVRNSYEDFKRTGSVEDVWHFAARSIFAIFFWTCVGYAIARWKGVLIWASGVFLYSFMVRDFNYRGHGGQFLSASQGAPINQPYYGIVAGEWHQNHHERPWLARSGLLWWQIDIPYLIIRSLSILGAVTHYNLPNKTRLSLSLAKSPRSGP